MTKLTKWQSLLDTYTDLKATYGRECTVIVANGKAYTIDLDILINYASAQVIALESFQQAKRKVKERASPK